VQQLGEGESLTDDFVLSTIDGTEVNVQITNDEAIIEGALTDSIILAFEDTTAEGLVKVIDIDWDESGVLAGEYSGNYSTLTTNADGLWFHQMTNFDLPFDGPFDIVNDTITCFTLGGDVFDINVAIEQDGFTIG
jgi:VCBS repeat-containing protein